MPQRLMIHDTDPAKVILDKVGSLAEFRLTSNWVLTGIYERPEKTASGLYLTDQTRREDEWQGKAMLILAMGPRAFQSDEHYTFTDGEKFQVGDWVSIFIQDGGRKLVINGQTCRLIRDVDISLGIPRPDAIF